MDPITLALATFGVQKLRGQSTKRAFRDALIMGGIGQLGSMTSMGQQAGLSGFGQGAGQLGAGGLGVKQQLAKTQASQLGKWAWGKPAIPETVGPAGKEFPAQPATGIRGWSTGAKLGAGLGIATLMEGDEDMPEPPFTEQDYKDAYAKQSKLTSGLGDAFQYTPSNVMYYGGPQTSDVYQYNQG